MNETVVMWFRRDLRLHDHPALHQALRSGSTIVPVFCFDPALLGGRHRSAPRTQFLLESLRELDRELRERGSRLIVRIGRPHEELAAVAPSVGAGEVFVTGDAGPFARRRDALVGEALREAGVRLVTHPGMFVVDDPAAITTGRGDPYTVFTPYHRAWLRAPGGRSTARRARCPRCRVRRAHPSSRLCARSAWTESRRCPTRCPAARRRPGRR
jgi:deoxyribodipyrimidine photo-lyase